MPECVFGVDRISLSCWSSEVVLPPFQGSAGPWETEIVKLASDGIMRPHLVHARLTLGGGTAYVSAREAVPVHDRAPYFVRVDWNPSAQQWGHTGELATLSDVPQLIELMVEAVANLVTIDTKWVTITRLDLTRDFRNVSDVPWMLLRLAAGASHAIRGRNGDVETVYWNGGPKSCRVMAYNKGVERGRNEEGWLRTEVRCGKPWLQKAGIGSLESLEPGPVDAMGRERWFATGLGTPMVRSERELVRLLMHRGMSGRQIAPFLGWVLCRDMPGGPAFSSATLAKYRKLEKSLGGVADLGTHDYDRVRLDLDSGMEVVETLEEPLAS